MFKSKEEKLALKVARKERRAEKLAAAEAQIAQINEDIKESKRKHDKDIHQLKRKHDEDIHQLKRKYDDDLQKANRDFIDGMREEKDKFKEGIREEKDKLKEGIADAKADLKGAISEFKENRQSSKGNFKKIYSDMKTMTAFDTNRLRYPKMTDDEKSAFETEAHAFLSNRFDLEYADLYLKLIHVENDPNSTMDDINPLRKRLKEMRKADVQAHKNSSKD